MIVNSLARGINGLTRALDNIEDGIVNTITFRSSQDKEDSREKLRRLFGVGMPDLLTAKNIR